MTRKDFIAAASIARRYVHPHRQSIAEAFADFFAASNPAFDRTRFFDACRLTPDGGIPDYSPAGHAVWTERQAANDAH